ncbi:helix-turn-helix domain-containing protein [Halobiforma nitratireducens]|uniref:Bacterio-opsin activator HTH domain-containing protein n=1 Tax=Halobiforma nitratireducens JCM 10879 TaxID=1227454 RepID=M0L2N0_9EURY|nr:helix-turn-helix domain-containing protein [Halobiforma nitratireducens]EMA27353.1 bacterio-opsin activator HTH domain-containing protein [Halobiforma nitratireducens JCM 10879]
MSDEPVDDRFRITVTVTDEETILDLVDRVDDVVDARVVPDGGGDALTRRQARPSTVRVDLRDLTPKQWEALELAFDQGYYDQPRSVDLEALSDDLDISKSAVSQRLRAAEATVVESVLEGAISASTE